MATRPLTDDEQDLADKLVQLVTLIPEVQDTARRVRENGGDVRAAFLSQIPPENHGEVMMQWPLISMFLGV